MEARRARLFPLELDNDPKLQQLQKSSIQSALPKWRLTLAENGDPTRASFVELKETMLLALRKATKAADDREAAEVAAAIEYFERTGQSPAGYDITS